MKKIMGFKLQRDFWELKRDFVPSFLINNVKHFVLFYYVIKAFITVSEQSAYIRDEYIEADKYIEIKCIKLTAGLNNGL